MQESVTRTQAIAAILKAKTPADLAILYSHDMECQVNVAQDGGERVEGEYRGRQWHGWSDGSGAIWKSFRIPYKAYSEPEYEDRPMTYDLAAHAEGIGMTGWDWAQGVSRWVAFDFDSLIGGHATGLNNEELEAVKKAAMDIPWVTVRLSTSGKGLHIYVFVSEVPTANHNEHAALARAILGMMSAHAKFDFNTKVDICGGNMWVWHRKMAGTEGLKLLKQGTVLHDVPPNWRDHIKVVRGKASRILPSFVETEQVSVFEELTGQRSKVPLDTDHQRLVKFLSDAKAQAWWDSDHHMLVTHTFDLKIAHEQLSCRGIFNTAAEGKDRGADHNCFMFPLRRGAWAVRRYTPGVSEHASWDQDANGWTRCYFNHEPDLGIASRTYDGVEDPSGGFVFENPELATNAAQAIGATIQLPAWMMSSRRNVLVKPHKDRSRVVVEIDYVSSDRQDDLKGWLHKKTKWVKVFHTTRQATVEPEVGNYDDVVRHLVTVDWGDYGWVLKSGTSWHDEPITHVKVALESLGLMPKDLKGIVGGSVFKPWRIVTLPFQPEYPGDRQWNRNAVQMKFAPSLEKETLVYPHWTKILDHVGMGLNEAVAQDGWCRANGLRSGADYLKCWMASLFQEPALPLPYLFLHGDQNTGKSILHEALERLLTRGYQRADAALISSSGFNGELENAILCVVEETDLRRNNQAYNRIKDWVTSPQLPIHRKMKTPYHATNTTHWIQCNNDREACPAAIGDTRITMIHVHPLDPLDMIPKKLLMRHLDKEAPDFLASLLKLEIPESNDRLNVPIMITEDKIQASRATMSVLDTFLEENTFSVPGKMITIAEFHSRFTAWLDPVEKHEWSKQRVTKNLPARVIRGRRTTDQAWCYGNIAWEEKEATREPLKISGDKLV